MPWTRYPSLDWTKRTKKMKTLPDWFEKRMDRAMTEMENDFKTTFDEAEIKVLKVAYMKGFKAARGM
jgi:hypothetical protein